MIERYLAIPREAELIHLSSRGEACSLTCHPVWGQRPISDDNSKNSLKCHEILFSYNYHFFICLLQRASKCFSKRTLATRTPSPPLPLHSTSQLDERSQRNGVLQ